MPSSTLERINWLAERQRQLYAMLSRLIEDGMTGPTWSERTQEIRNELMKVQGERASLYEQLRWEQAGNV